MSLARTLAVCLALAVALGVAFQGASPAAAADRAVRLVCSLESDTVKLGEEVIVRVRVENRSAQDVVVPALRLADDSVSVKLEGGGSPSLVTRRYGHFVAGEEGPVFERKRSPQRRLVPGGRLETTVRFAAVRTGDLSLTPVLGPEGPTRLAGSRLALRVQPRGPGDKPLVLAFETARGTFRVRLDGTKAFNSVSHFWTLAREGFFDQLRVHRVIADVLVQSGDPRGDGLGGPGWYLPAESQTADLPRGTVALARGSHVDSAGSQWFVTLGGAGSAEAFKPGFTALGMVMDGLHVVDELAAVTVKDRSDKPVSPDRVVSVKPSR